MKKKYKLSETDTIMVNEHILHRIIALRDVNSNVSKGDAGGYIESYTNLSRKGQCWVYDNAIVYENARVMDNAQIYHSSTIHGCSIIQDDVTIGGNADICGNSIIGGEAIVEDDARIDSSCIHDNVHAYGNVYVKHSQLGGFTVIFDSAKIINSILKGSMVARGKSKISNVHIDDPIDVCNFGYITGDNDYAYIKGFGRKNRGTTFFLQEDNSIYITCGCFQGNLAEFRSAVKYTHRNKDITLSPLGEEYMDIADLMEKRFKRIIEIKKENYYETSLIDRLYESKKSDKSHPDEDGCKERLYLDFTSAE